MVKGITIKNITTMTYNYNYNGNQVSVTYDNNTCAILTQGQEVVLPRTIMANNIRNIESSNSSNRTKGERCIYNVWQAGTTRIG